MNTKSELHFLDIEPETQTRLVVIWLHGLGANANDFEPILPIINQKITGIRYIFPNAPLKSVSVNGGMMMPAWYDVRSPNLSVDQDLTGIEVSSDQLEQLVVQIQQEIGSTTPIVLAGFSQGGVIALTTALTRDISVLGILALSTYFPHLPEKQQITTKCPHLLMMHGNSDPVVAINYAEKSFQKLSGYISDAQWKTYPMDHSLCYEQVIEIADWFEEILKTN